MNKYRWEAAKEEAAETKYINSQCTERTAMLKAYESAIVCLIDQFVRDMTCALVGHNWEYEDTGGPESGPCLQAGCLRCGWSK